MSDEQHESTVKICGDTIKVISPVFWPADRWALVSPETAATIMQLDREMTVFLEWLFNQGFPGEKPDQE